MPIAKAKSPPKSNGAQDLKIYRERAGTNDKTPPESVFMETNGDETCEMKPNENKIYTENCIRALYFICPSTLLGCPISAHIIAWNGIAHKHLRPTISVSIRWIPATVASSVNLICSTLKRRNKKEKKKQINVIKFNLNAMQLKLIEIMQRHALCYLFSARLQATGRLLIPRLFLCCFFSLHFRNSVRFFFAVFARPKSLFIIFF